MLFAPWETRNDAMEEIDIDSLDEAALMALNARIVDRLHLLHQQKTTAALREIRIGRAVRFEGPGGGTVEGIVIRRNRKTVTVHADDERQWNVSPSLLKPADRDGKDAVGSGVSRVVPFSRPGGR